MNVVGWTLRYCEALFFRLSSFPPFPVKKTQLLCLATTKTMCYWTSSRFLWTFHIPSWNRNSILRLPRPRWCATSTYSVCSCRLTRYSEMQNAKEKNAKTMCHDMMSRNLLMTCSKTHYVHGPHPLARFHPAASHLHASSQGILHLLDMLLLYELHERLEDFVNLMSQSESSMECWIAFFPKQLIYIVYSYASSAQDRRTCGPPGQLRRKLRPSTSKQVWRTWQLQRCHEENTTASTAPEVLGPRKPNRKVAPGTTVKICVKRKTAWFNNSTDSGMVIVTVSKLNLCLTTLLAKHLRTL